MDGEKPFATLIDELEWDKNLIVNEATIRKYLFDCIHLYEMGYLTLQVQNETTKEDVTKALESLGVKAGDTVLVHSSLSGLGYIAGGAKTALEAFQELLGENGTMLAPAFCWPYTMFEAEINKSIKFRPYDKRSNGMLRDKAITTGLLPRTMLQTEGSCRSGHATHEWVAIGKHAEEMVSGHGFLDAPAGVTSPLDKALKKKASVIFFGCRISANTFLHYLEEIATDIPKPAAIEYIDENGELHMGLMPRQYPGDRDFYHIPESGFYREAVKRGLKIHAAKCGIGTIYKMELENVYKDIFAWPTKKIMAAKNGYTTRIPFIASKEIREQAKGVFF